MSSVKGDLYTWPSEHYYCSYLLVAIKILTKMLFM